MKQANKYHRIGGSLFFSLSHSLRFTFVCIRFRMFDSDLLWFGANSEISFVIKRWIKEKKSDGIKKKDLETFKRKICFSSVKMLKQKLVSLWYTKADWRDGVYTSHRTINKFTVDELAFAFARKGCDTQYILSQAVFTLHCFPLTHTHSEIICLIDVRLKLSCWF